MKIILFAFAIVALSTQCLGQSINWAKIDSFASALDKHQMAMGSVAISIDGKICYQRAIGLRFINGSSSLAADAATMYRIGSTTKMFTAVMISQLVEERKLRLDDRLSNFFPTLPNAAVITIGQMLYHRSGLPEYTEPFPEFERWMDSTQTRTQLLKLIASRNPVFEPGEKTKYCNSNFLILSYIIEKLDKLPYRLSVKKRITDRLHLDNTCYAKPFDSSKNEALSYAYGLGKWTPQKSTDTSIHQGAGLMMSTPTDMVHFIHALFNNRLLQPLSLKQMTSWIDQIGMGIFPVDVDGVKGAGHDGHIEGFRSSLSYFPEKKLAIAYCTNGEVYAKNDLVQILSRICLNKPQIIPLFETVIVADSILTKYAGNYVNDELDIEVVITKAESTLMANVKGNNFNIEPLRKNQFIFRLMGLLFTFDENTNELIIHETYKSYRLQKRN